MKFDKSKVFTVFNLDEIKIGSKVYADDYRTGLIKKVESENENPRTLIEIDEESDDYPFLTEDINGGRIPYDFVYLISEPEEKKLKVSDLKIGDIVRHKSRNLEYLVTGIDYDEEQVLFNDIWFDDDGDLGDWWEKVEND